MGERGFTIDATHHDRDGWTVLLQAKGDGPPQTYLYPGPDLHTGMLAALGWYEPLLAVQLGADAEFLLANALAGRKFQG